MEGETGGKVELYREALPREKKDGGQINSLVEKNKFQPNKNLPTILFSFRGPLTR